MITIRDYLRRIGRRGGLKSRRSLTPDQAREMVRRREEKKALRRWVATWRAAGPALEAHKQSELRKLDTVRALAQLAAAYEQALRHAPTAPETGLVEQQRWFARVGR